MQYSIGSGDTTIISDTWLPTTPPRAPRLLPYTNPQLSVKTLIDPISNQWDLEVIRDLIEQTDIPLIQKVYLPYQPATDGIIWPYTPDGNYSVKSGYHYITTTQDAEFVPPPLASSPALTKKIWPAPIPPKLKHFFWKIGSRIVAVKENLRHRHIPVDPTCPRCCDNNESSDHAFFTCLFSQQVWRLSGSPVSLTTANDSLLNKLETIFSFASNNNLPDEQKLLPFWVVWRLWKCRNDLLFNKIQYTADEVISKARTDLKEWLDSTVSSQITNFTQITRSGNIRSHWSPPPLGWVKCNYDAADREGPHDSGMGWLIRNKHGTLLEAGMGKFEGRSTVMESELSSLIWSMQACSSLGYRNVIFEGDNLSILKYIKGEAYSSRCQHLVNSVIAWKSRFLSTSFVHVYHVYRQHNG